MRELTINNLLEIAENSITFSEKINFFLHEIEKKDNESVNSSKDVTSEIDQWCQVSCQKDWGKFKKRLSWDNLDLNIIQNALSSKYLTNESQVPSWIKTLYSILRSTSNENNTFQEIHFLYTQEPLPFEEVLLPFIYVAINKLKDLTGTQYSLLSVDAHANLERSLLIWLSHICSPCLELDFSIFRASRQPSISRFFKNTTDNNSNKLYQEFINRLLTGGLLTFFQEYPVLARLMAEAIDVWVDKVQEFISHLESDWLEIQKLFQPDNELAQVISVQPELSDRHHNGRSVMALTFSSGLKLIYKPKNLGIEEAYTNLIDWLNKYDVPLKFKSFKILKRSTYGWVEFIQSLPCKDRDEARRYYQRMGILLCLTHILEGTDLHNENVIACGEHPVLIDLETLMHPRVKEVQNSEASQGSQSLAYQQLCYSVLRTGLLPEWQISAEGYAYDSSALGSVFSHQETCIQVRHWLNINTDAMVVRCENTTIQPSQNAPSLEGTNLFLDDYHQEIIDGFRRMYQFLMKHHQKLLANDSPLSMFASQEIRFVFRPTQIYSSTLKKTLDPKFLRNGINWSIQFDILSRAMLLSDFKPFYWPLLAQEQQALERMDIPLFTARSDSDSLTTKSNQTIENYFTEPSFYSVVNRIKQLDYVDLEQQINFIRASLYSRTVNNAHSLSFSKDLSCIPNPINQLKEIEITQQAINIALELQKHAIYSEDGGSAWNAPQYILNAQKFNLQPIAYSLYDGSCGVALFLAAIEKVTNEVIFHELSIGTLQSLRKDLQGYTLMQNHKDIGIGGAAGFGSIIYVLTRVSQFINEPELLEDAKQIASLITPDFLDNDRKFDILSGSAGAILGLLTLYKNFVSSDILEKAISCGHHLLKNRVVSDLGHKAWATLDDKLLTGFSHGAAGIAYALLRLYQATGESEFLNAAQEAIAYERSVFIPEEGNWPDFRESATKNAPACMCSWCHGAPGIGLARVAGLDILDTPEIRQDIQAAIDTTMQTKLSGIDHLCCGNLGLTEFLFTAGRKLSQPELVEAAMTQAAQVVARAEQRGHFGYGLSLTFHPGFFQGASGIGYQLLRLAYPDQLPSVLLWE